MHFVVMLLSVWIFIKTFSFGLFEMKQEKFCAKIMNEQNQSFAPDIEKHQNKSGGIIVIILAFFALILPSFISYLVGIY